MIEEITLTGGEYISNITGVSMCDITNQGRIRIQVQGESGGDIVDILDETLPQGKVWKARISISITVMDA